MTEFKPGKYTCADGVAAVILCDDAPGDCPLVGYRIHDASATQQQAIPTSWESDGRCCIGARRTQGRSDPWDLKAAKVADAEDFVPEGE